MATSAQKAFAARQAALKKGAAQKKKATAARAKQTAQDVEFNTRNKQRGTASNPRPRTTAQNRVSSKKNKMLGQLPDDTGRQYQGPNGKMLYPKGMSKADRKAITPQAYKPKKTKSTATAKPMGPRTGSSNPKPKASDLSNAVKAVPRLKKRENAINKLTKGIR